MANLSLRHIYKVYPNGLKAVSDFNMEIKDKEFIVFVGPSGCGKSTTLRMIAGLEDITAGELYINNELVNDMEPKDRDIAMVFQNYALYPHMNVYDNMAFGLKLRHVPREEIHKKVLWAAKVLKLTEYLDTKPRAMSGGQRQRVALGRAILRNPKVFLLDEPLSNLDAKLRTEMRAEIAKLHQQLQTTFIYVTHDQVEAMTLGTRVVVMKLGVIQQIDTPQNLYEFPENKFVAGFIGTPQMNFFEATLERKKDDVIVKFDYSNEILHVPFNDLLKVRPKYLHGKDHVWVGLRCEDISLNQDVVKTSKNKMKIKVSHFEELGNETLVYGDLNMEGNGFDESSTRVIVKSYHNTIALKPGDVIEAAFDMKKAHFFNKENEKTILPRIPYENVFDCDIKDNVASFLNLNLKLPKALSVKDVNDAELFVPTNAITFDGKIPAEVEKTEEVNGTKICYLKIEDRTFFVIVNKEYEKGTIVKLNFDFKKILIKKNDVDFIKPLFEKDVFLGSFTNLNNSKNAVKSILNLKKNLLDEKIKNLTHEMNIKLLDFGVSDYLYKTYKEEYIERLKANKQERSSSITSHDLSKEGKKKVEEKYLESNIKAKADYDEKIAYLNSKKVLNDGKGNSNEIVKIKDEYASKIDSLTKNYEEYKAMTIESAKKLASEAKAEEIKLKTNLLSAKTALSAKLKEKLANINVKYGNDKEKETVKKAAINEAKTNYDKELQNITLNSKLFYACVNGEYVKSNIDINKKIIQALGVAVFKSNYRYELSHYSYSIVNDGGFKALVIDNLDYGNEKFVKCLVFGQEIYVSVMSPIKVGSEIHLTYSLEGVQIYENKFDIRLY